MLVGGDVKRISTMEVLIAKQPYPVALIMNQNYQ
jgi:hypothetical protein